jgi:chromosome segregation ATPase
MSFVKICPYCHRDIDITECNSCIKNDTIAALTTEVERLKKSIENGCVQADQDGIYDMCHVMRERDMFEQWNVNADQLNVNYEFEIKSLRTQVESLTRERDELQEEIKQLKRDLSQADTDLLNLKDSEGID